MANWTKYFGAGIHASGRNREREKQSQTRPDPRLFGALLLRTYGVNADGSLAALNNFMVITSATSERQFRFGLWF